MKKALPEAPKPVNFILTIPTTDEFTEELSAVRKSKPIYGGDSYLTGSLVCPCCPLKNLIFVKYHETSDNL
jgi:hypothetical protein